MPLLKFAMSRQESRIVIKRLDIVVWVRAEKMTEKVGVARCVLRPHIPDFVAKGVGYEFVLWAFHYVVRTDIWRLSVWIVGGVEFLGWEEAEMFAPEKTAQGGGVVAGFVGLAVHSAVEEVLVFHYDGEFGVVDA